MKWFIHRRGTDSYIASEIDSGGMSVFLVPRESADEFDNAASARGFLDRVVERYPSHKDDLEVVHYGE